MIRKICLLWLSCIVSLLVFSQDVSLETAKSNPVLEKYERNALSIIVLENSTEYNSDLVGASKGVGVPDKFDNNNLELRHIKTKDKSNITIQKKLVDEKVPNAILEKWFSRNDQGEFDMSLVFERGMYNATDDEVVKASSSKLGVAALKDAGETLIDNSYIIILDFSGIQSMREIYNKRDLENKAYAEKTDTKFRPTARTKNGWKGNVTAYLFKMNFTDSLVNFFYNDLWIYEDDDEKLRLMKKAKFDEAEFPLPFVMKVAGEADGTQYKPGHVLAPPKQLTRDELFQKMITTGMNTAIESIERSHAKFQVKTPVYKAKPISAKIGRKEGLKTDQRYFVTEQKQKSNGQIVNKRKAVVRAKKVINNKEVASGKSEVYSTFYQTSGLGVEEGMTLQQKNDMGIGVSGGYCIGEMGGGFGRVEMNVARLSASVIDIGVTQLKTFGAFAFDYKDYDIEGNSYDMSFMRWQAGVSKGFYFAHNFSVGLLFAYGQEIATNDDFNDEFFSGDSDGQVVTEFLNAGGFATINITHFMQIMGTFNYYMHIVSPYDHNKEGIDDFSNYTDLFKNRNGMSIDLGIRIEI